MKNYIWGIMLFLFANANAQFSINQGTFISNGKSKTIIPVEVINDKIILNVKINGIKGRFILDTGAPLVLSKSVHRKLILDTLAILPNRDANANIDTTLIVKTNKVSIGDFDFLSVPAVVLDLQKTPLRCDSIDGFIGSNLLKHTAVEFLLEDEIIIIYADSVSGKYSNSVSFFMDNQSTPLIEVSVNGKKDTAMFDTGDNSFYTANNDYVVSNLTDFNILLSGSGTQGQSVFGIGESTFTYLLMGDLQVGNYSIDDMRFTTTPASISRIGFRFLVKNKVLLDYISKNLEYMPVKKEQEYRTHGFTVYEKDQKIYVGTIWNTSQIKGSGLNPDDEIIEINNISLRNRDFCKILDELQSALQEQQILIKFVSKNDHKIKSVELKNELY